MRGGDTSALRAYNERLLLDAIRARGPLSKAELARATGLSAQAASVIVRDLIAGGMLVENAKVRGRIGQPMTPLALNPRGAFSAGLKIGRRSVDAVLVDFAGAPVATRRAGYGAPLRGPTMAAALDGIAAVLGALGPDERARVVGLGVAMPGQLHLWADELGLPPGALRDWEGADPAADLHAATGLPVSVCNDATAACAAELSVGAGVVTANTLYIHIGAFVGGGVVVGGRLQQGGRGNAGAIGSMPMPGAGRDGRPRQLIHEASLVVLERALREAGVEPFAAISDGAGGDRAEAAFAAWALQAAPALARATAAAASVFDFETVVVDGGLNRRWLSDLTAAAAARMADFDLSGLSPLSFACGGLGADARMLGAALLPLHARFSPQAEMLARLPAGEDGRLAAQ
jgi:predicted NBD/HSP70 family sugar kinase